MFLLTCLRCHLQRRDMITRHQFALHLIADSTVIPNYLSLNPCAGRRKRTRGRSTLPASPVRPPASLPPCLSVRSCRSDVLRAMVCVRFVACRRNRSSLLLASVPALRAVLQTPRYCVRCIVCRNEALRCIVCEVLRAVYCVRFVACRRNRSSCCLSPKGPPVCLASAKACTFA